MSGMTGGSSSSHTSVSAETFRLDDNASVIALLRRVHQLGLEPTTKNKLRDAVFTYRSGGGAVEDQEIINLFKEQGIQVLATAPDTTEAKPEHSNQTHEAEVPAQQTARTHVGRPVPSFGSVSAVQEPASVRAHSVSEEPVKEVVNEEPAVKSIDETSPAEGEVRAGTQEQPKAEVEPTAPPAETTEAKNVATPSEPDADNPSLKRIQAIKHEVNGLVGNPVHLINVDNVIGREYMNSLVDALKKVNSGASTDGMERAMARLEQAFSNVKAIMKEQSAHEAVAEEKTAVAETATPETREEKSGYAAKAEASEIEESTEQKKTTPQTITETKKEMSETSASEKKSPSEPESSTQTNQESARKIPVLSSLLEEVDKMDIDDTPATNEQSDQPESVEEKTTDTESPAPVSDDQPDDNTESQAFKPVAKEKKIKDMLQEREIDMRSKDKRLADERAENPLTASDVEAGLEQLLSEWDIFKSSGFLGTGPGGKEHPLYKKISGLTMATVLAGRFEGATASVKQNITRYMSGWRYEQGITYEHGETFEHYLRRVIRHIIDRKAGRAE